MNKTPVSVSRWLLKAGSGKEEERGVPISGCWVVECSLLELQCLVVQIAIAGTQRLRANSIFADMYA